MDRPAYTCQFLGSQVTLTPGVTGEQQLLDLSALFRRYV